MRGIHLIRNINISPIPSAGSAGSALYEAKSMRCMLDSKSGAWITLPQLTLLMFTLLLVMGPESENIWITQQD